MQSIPGDKHEVESIIRDKKFKLTTMKRVLFIAFMILLHQQVYAQDRIIKVSGEEVLAHVLEITLQEILFQHPDSLQGTTQRMAKSDVFMVRFENGTKEVFAHNLPDDPANALVRTPAEMYQLGKEDASIYYKGNGAMWGSAASTFVMFPLGLAGSVVIGATKPKVDPRWVSDVNLISDPAYARGYQEQAARKKKNKALAGAGIGLGIQLTAIMILLATAY
jgi:hypothetical protein